MDTKMTSSNSNDSGDYSVEEVVIRSRVISLADLILSLDLTIAETAEATGLTEDIVHTDMYERLPGINELLAREVHAVLDYSRDVIAEMGNAAAAQHYLERRFKKQFDAVLEARKKKQSKERYLY